MSADEEENGRPAGLPSPTWPKVTEVTRADPRLTRAPWAFGARVLGALWKLGLGSWLSTFFASSVLVVGWTTRAAQREVLRTWWRGRPGRLPNDSFAAFVRADPHTAEYAHWPRWILGERPIEGVNPGRSGRRLAGWMGGLWLNARLGSQVAFNTAVLTLPGCLLWAVAWFAGWQNSFNKGYEHAWFGPLVFVLGMLMFTAAMAYVPWGQARQASTGDWRRFYDFRIVWRLIRRRWLSSVGLALLWAGGMGLVLAVKLIPALAQYVPQLADLSPPEALQVSQRFFGLAALILFPVYVLLRWVAARVYGRALQSAFQAGAMTEDDLGEAEWQAWRRLGLLQPHPVPERGRLVRLARWLATRTGQVSAGAALFAIWFGLSFLIIVSEFLNKTEFGRGWWNQPMIQLPWFDYTPNRLREAARLSEAIRVKPVGTKLPEPVSH